MPKKKKSTIPSLDTLSKYNKNTGRWTVFVPNKQIWYVLRVLEDAILEFKDKYPNNLVRKDTYFQYVEIYLYESVEKTLRKAAKANKNFLNITKTEALALTKLDKNCEAYLNKIT